MDDSEFGEQLLQNLEDFEKKTKSGNVNNNKSRKPEKRLETITLVLPYDDLNEIDENEVLGIWSDNVEESDERARRVREQNRRTT